MKNTNAAIKINMKKLAKMKKQIEREGRNPEANEILRANRLLAEIEAVE